MSLFLPPQLLLVLHIYNHNQYHQRQSHAFYDWLTDWTGVLSSQWPIHSRNRRQLGFNWLSAQRYLYKLKRMTWVKGREVSRQVSQHFLLSDIKPGIINNPPLSVSKYPFNGHYIHYTCCGDMINSPTLHWVLLAEEASNDPPMTDHRSAWSSDRSKHS